MLSCDGSDSNKVGGGNFYVHFDDKQDQPIAEQIAHFWKEKELITGRDQDIKLVRSGNHYELLLVLSKPEDHFILPADELQRLFYLQNDLNEYVKSTKPIEIVIADNTFKNIVNINQ